jgi:hypothetical protein
MATEEVLEALLKLDESPWGNLRGKPLMSRGLSSRLGKYGIHPTQVWIAGANVRGYKAEDLADAWTRYVTPDILGTAAYEPARSARTLGIDPEPSVLADLAAPMAGVPSPFDAVPGHSSNGSNTLNGHMKPECRYCGQPAAGSTDGFCDNLDASHMQAREFAGLAFTPGRPE